MFADEKTDCIIFRVPTLKPALRKNTAQKLCFAELKIGLLLNCGITCSSLTGLKMRYPEYVFIAAICAGLALFQFYTWLKLRRKVADIIATPTSSIASILDSPKTPGKVVEIKGAIVAGPESLLLSPFAGKECVFYCSIEKEKIREVTNSGRGRSVSVYVRTADEKRSLPKFYVEDKTGKIAIDPDGMEIDGLRVFNSSEPVGSAAGGSMFDSFFESSSSK
jgi:hypothetical protein